MSAACAVALIVSGCANGASVSDPEPVDPADYEVGRTLYAEFCASCHADDGSGGVGPALADGRAVDRIGGVPEIGAVIAEGGDRMPGLEARLDPEQIDAIARYVQDRL